MRGTDTKACPLEIGNLHSTGGGEEREADNRHVRHIVYELVTCAVDNRWTPRSMCVRAVFYCPVGGVSLPRTPVVSPALHGAGAGAGLSLSVVISVSSMDTAWTCY